MSRLDATLNQKESWKEMRDNAQRRIKVDIDEVERVIELARRTPGLSQYEDKLYQLLIYFETMTQFRKVLAPSALIPLVRYWERYREAVIQHYSGITPIELRAASKVVKDIFRRFMAEVPENNILYSSDAEPIVYGGPGGPGAYFTHPAQEDLPFAIISLPHTAFYNVWQWLALPHETGHNFFATIKGLKEQLENELADRIKKAVSNGKIEIPDVTIDLKPFGINYKKNYKGKSLIEKIWRCWANEAQADIVGILTCGGAAIIGLQQIIGFRAVDAWTWKVSPDGNIDSDNPEEHPTAYIRNAMNIEALRLMSEDHAALAKEIEKRFQSLKPSAEDVTWYLIEARYLSLLEPDIDPKTLNLSEEFIAAKVPINEMVKSAKIAADVILNHKLNCLGGKSYKDLVSFTGADQEIVDEIASILVTGFPTFAQVEDSTPRHALAATIFAFEKDRSKANLINRTFKHFV
jgi:hypothetical protein